MGEISTTIAEAIRNRTTSTALVTYSVFWLIWHWQGVSTLLFTDEARIYEKFNLLKNEYLGTYFFGWHGMESIIGFLAPLLLTLVFIWPFQKYVLIHAYKIEQGSKVDRKKVRLRAERDVEIYKAELLSEESKKIDAQAKKVTAETKLSQTKKRAQKTDPTILWDEDYETMKKTIFYDQFKQIRESIYEHTGNLYVGAYENGGKKFNVDSSLLAYVDTEGLVVIDQKANKISLTEKGKFFIKRYQQDTSATIDW